MTTLVSSSPSPVKRPFRDDDGDVNMYNYEDESVGFSRECSSFKRAKKTTDSFDENENIVSDPVSISHGPFMASGMFPYNLSTASYSNSNGGSSSDGSVMKCNENGESNCISSRGSSSSSGGNDDMNLFNVLTANEENEIPLKSSTNKFIFSNSISQMVKRSRLTDISTRSSHGGGSNRSGIGGGNLMTVNPASMQSMYEAQLANSRKDITKKNLEVHSLRTKNTALKQDNTILKKAVNILESRQRELSSHNQQLEATLCQTVDYIESLEKVIQSLRVQLNGSNSGSGGGPSGGSGPFYSLDEPPPDVF